MNNNPPRREALLDNGQIVEYDIMSRDKYAVLDPNYRYLGTGTIYAINGAVVSDKGRKHFWVRKEKK